MEKEAICMCNMHMYILMHMNPRILKWGVGTYTEMGAYSGDYSSIPFTC